MNDIIPAVPHYPMIDVAVPPNNQTAIRMGEVLMLRGHDLDGNDVRAQFVHFRSNLTLISPALSEGATANRFCVKVPADRQDGLILSSSDPDSWQAGVYSVAAIVTDFATNKMKNDRSCVTNKVSVALAPAIVGPILVDEQDKTLKVICKPKVWQTQKASLIVGAHELIAEPIMSPDNGIEVAKTDTLLFKYGDMLSGLYWVFLRVDGVDSILLDRSSEPPKFDPNLKVEIPKERGS